MSSISPNGHTTVPLSNLVPGQQGLIVRVGGHTNLRRRLLEMGLVRGETISVERVAPLGDPIEFTIKGYHLSLRRSDAANIEVQPNHQIDKVVHASMVHRQL